MENKLDYKKEFKDLYMPKKKPTLIEVPAMNFIMIDGKGDPNEENGEYSKAVELLYALCYTIKMSKKGQNKIEGYFEYVVPPLEGLWWCDEGKIEFLDKSKFHWTSMIRQPEFVTDEVFKWSCSEVLKKKPQLDISKARFRVLKEGLCVQMMHIGPFDNETETVNEIEDYIEKSNLRNAISEVNDDGRIRRHHEIYLSDPRKIDKQKIKTVLRIPVERK